MGTLIGIRTPTVLVMRFRGMSRHIGATNPRRFKLGGVLVRRLMLGMWAGGRGRSNMRWNMSHLRCVGGRISSIAAMKRDGARENRHWGMEVRERGMVLILGGVKLAYDALLFACIHT
jgi:hypothetical protein